MGKKWTVAQKKAAREKRLANATARDAVSTENTMAANNQPEPSTASAPPEAPSEDSKLDAILQLVKSFDSRLETVENRTPMFVPAPGPETSIEDRSDTYRPEGFKGVTKGVAKDGDFDAGGIRSTDNPEYVRSLPPNQRPIFQAGSQVRLNPDAEIIGAERPCDNCDATGVKTVEEGTVTCAVCDGNKILKPTWASVLKGKPGIGEVKSLQYLDKTWEPKYTVRITGITAKAGSGYRESELLPA